MEGAGHLPLVALWLVRPRWWVFAGILVKQ
jgi:hypothetical protein